MLCYDRGDRQAKASEGELWVCAFCVVSFALLVCCMMRVHIKYECVTCVSSMNV